MSLLRFRTPLQLIHAYFEDDLDNFTLTLNNPSTQAEMLKVEHTQLKVTLFKDATSDLGNGFATMSMTRGHRELWVGLTMKLNKICLSKEWKKLLVMN
jgi:hypothetical protein